MTALRSVALLCFVCFPVFLAAEVLDVQVSAAPGVELPAEGRLFVAFSANNDEEPRLTMGSQVENADPFFAIDVAGWDGAPVSLTAGAIGYPLHGLSDIPEKEWYVQALYDTNRVFSDVNAPGNFYSEVVHVADSGNPTRLSLVLSKQEPPEALPEDTAQLKFIRMPSALLSDFYGEDIYLRAAVLLPASYESSAAAYPVAYHIGGLNARYTRALELLEDEEFTRFWDDPESPQIIMVFLDGESPFGDSYQINSANSGPYGDANMRELFPAIEARFRVTDSAAGRFVTGRSTGGWASLALQIFHPEHFNGVWSFSPDSLSFEALQLVNLKEDTNAFTNEFGYERPSRRELTGEPVFSIRQEIALETVLGAGNSFAFSGQQWGTWNAVFGPRRDDGTPALIWNQETGEIDKEVAAAWSRYDLTEYLKSNWSGVGPHLVGKINVRTGDMDNYYLNVATRIFERELAELTSPDPGADFTYVPYHDHSPFGIEVEYIAVIEAMVRKYQAAPPGATRITP